MRIGALLLIGTAATLAPLSAQDWRIEGRLRPEVAGVPYAGAAVTIVETGETYCADENGRFALDLPPGESRLRVSPVGFPPMEITVAPGDDEILLSLPEHVINLKGLTVIAYAVSPRRRDSPFTASILEAAMLTQVPGDLTKSLEGKIPGADISANSGAPGGGYRMGIRGVRTILGSSEPLVVIDGVMMSSTRIGSGVGSITGARDSELDPTGRLADLNPMDIARIEVVKGIAASQQYGAHAQNGVLVITTRRGGPRATEPVIDPSVACYRMND